MQLLLGAVCLAITSRDIPERNAGQASLGEIKPQSFGAVCNAGVSFRGPLADGDPQAWREMLEVNVLALAVGSQAAVRAMRACGAQGHIVSISSSATRLEAPGFYGATKTAVDAITASLRQELASDNGALARRKQLQGGDEGQGDRLRALVPGLRSQLRLGQLAEQQVGIRFEPRHIAHPRRLGRVGPRLRGIHRHAPATGAQGV